MSKLFAMLLLSSAVGCVADAGTSSTTSEIKVNPATDGTEPAYVDHQLCRMIFPGSLTPSTQTYAIWPIGTHGIVNTTYNTDRPNLYAVFGTSAAPFDIHHVAGFDQFDHYHVFDNNQKHDDGDDDGEVHVKNKVWDLMVLTPGPNFNLATYHTATSAAEVLAQSAAGILGPVSTPAIFGLPGLVLYAPVDCRQPDEE